MRRRTKICALLIPLALAGAVIAGVTGVVRNHRAQVRSFRERHAESKILGRPAADIIATHGEPYYLQRDPDGRPAFIVYKQPARGQYCNVELKDAVAVRVWFTFQ
jgi:hypothetical protein